MAELIKYEDDLRTGTDKLNKSIKASNRAEQKSDQAVNTSNEAKSQSQLAEDKADNVQEQFNQVVIEGDSSVEAAQARVDSEGNTYSTLKERLDDKETEFSSQLAQTMKRTSQEISVLEFGADPTGQTVSTQAFIDCANYCEANKKNMRIPDGDFWINGNIPFPNYYAVIGNGFRTNIMVDLPESEYVWKESDSFRYGWGFEGLRFTLKNNANKNVGGIYVELAFRGAYINNIWSYELRRPLYLGSKIWGICSVKNIFLYLLSENLDPTITTPAFMCKGNTLMLDNIEIIGGWNKGLHLDGVTVFKLNGFNIGGSNSTIQMLEPIYIENTNSGKLTSGWIEQLVDNETTANGREIYANGTGRAIYIKDSGRIVIEGSNLSSGSIYADNSKITVSQISYGQVNAGLRYLNGSIIHTDISGVKHQSIGIDEYADGIVYFQNALNYPAPLNVNPTLTSGQDNNITATNANLVTISDDTVDFESGGNALKVLAENFHGARFTMTNLEIDKTYTVVAKVKTINNIRRLRLINDSNTLIGSTRPQVLKRDNAEGYYTLIYHFTATNTTASVKLETLVQTTDSRGEYNLDSIACYRGYNVFDPSQI